MDEETLIRQIDELLRRSPPPPEHVLESVVRVLREVRGAGATVPTESLSKSFTESGASLSQGSVVPAPATTACKAAVSGDAMSLPNMGVPDTRWEAFKQRHEGRPAVAKPVDVRGRKIAQYQALLEGAGGKYVHADYVANGATQIAGVQSFTPSLTAADGPKQMGLVGGAMAAGKQPYNADNKFNFRP